MSQPHNVFISWAGEHARKIALILRDWLPDVCKDAKPWMSEKDIDKGADWSSAIDQTLATCKVCIVILTPESVKSHWVHFEAGALYKGLGQNAVCTLLCGATTPIAMPLGKFQRTDFNKESVEQLTITVSEILGTEIDKPRHTRAIEKYWPDLEKQVSDVLKTMGGPTPAKQKTEERLMLEEILENTRSIAQKPARTAGDEQSNEQTRILLSRSLDRMSLADLFLKIQHDVHRFTIDFIDKKAVVEVPQTVLQASETVCLYPDLSMGMKEWAITREAPKIGFHVAQVLPEVAVKMEVVDHPMSDGIRCLVRSVYKPK